MAEENGILVIKGPENLLKKFIGAEGSDTSELLLELAELTGMQRKFLDRENYEFYSSELDSGYLKLEYDCSEWSYISASIVHTAKDIELYSRVTNEYGVQRYFALTNRGKKFVYSIDPESGQLDKKKGAEEAVHQLNEWLDRIPEGVNKAFPSLSTIDIDSIVPPKLRKKKKIRINLKCKFDQSITEEAVDSALQGKFNDFELTSYVNSEHAGGSNCGYWEKCRIQTMGLNPEHFESYKVGFWFPITSGKKTANDLIDLLVDAGISPKYAIEFYGEKSAPYKILHSDGQSMQIVFDSSECSEQELNALCDDVNDELDMKINWFSMEFEQIQFIHENYDLKKYAKDRLKSFRKEFDEDSEQHKKILDDNPGMQEPLLKGLELAFFYKGLSEVNANNLVDKLQIKGMHKNSIEQDLSRIAGENVIVVPDEYDDAAKWLKNNIQELEDHKVIVDSLLESVVVINMS